MTNVLIKRREDTERQQRMSCEYRGRDLSDDSVSHRRAQAMRSWKIQGKICT